MSNLARRLPSEVSPHLPDYAKDKDRPYEGDPWQRQPKETSTSYSAFQKYLELGGSRTVAEAARVAERSPRVCYGWSTKHRWVERAEAWDAFQDTLRINKLRRQKIKAAERHAEDAMKVQEVLTRPMDKLRDRLVEVLDGKRPDWLDNLDDEELTKLAKAFGESLPAMQKAERDALGSVDDVPVRDTKLKMKGEVLRRILGDKSMVGVLERAQFEIEETTGE